MMAKSEEGYYVPNQHERQYLKLLLVTMYDVQKLRIMIGNRIGALDRAEDVSQSNMADELKEDLFDLADQMELAIEKRIARAMQGLRIMEWCKKVRGIGTRYAASLIGMLGEPTKTVSQLWGYCGMDVLPVCSECGKIAFRGAERRYFLNRQVERRWGQHQRRIDGDQNGVDEEDFKVEWYQTSALKLCQCDMPKVEMKAPKRIFFSGLLLDWQPFLKDTCWKISGQFVKQGKFYRMIYDQRKEMYTERDGDRLSAGHIENRARRATVKLFLSHFWEMWRKSLGMPAGETYLQHKLGADFDKHHTYIAPPYADMFDDIEPNED